MKLHCLPMVVIALVLAASPAEADTKIVKVARSDAVAIIGDSGHASETRTVFWVGDDRLRMDAGDTSIIVRGDEKKMFVIDHTAKAHSTLGLPLDSRSLVPDGHDDSMLRRVEYEVTVTPTDEWAAKGRWKARRFDVTFISSMARVESRVWATQDVEMDIEAFRALYNNILLLQPGMARAVKELRKIDGLEVANEAILTASGVGGSPVASHEETLSIETIEAPASTYGPPDGYEERDFDLSMLTGGG